MEFIRLRYSIARKLSPGTTLFDFKPRLKCFVIRRGRVDGGAAFLQLATPAAEGVAVEALAALLEPYLDAPPEPISCSKIEYRALRWH
jgi:hypothetical protein